jgi:hypothetical protein
MIISISINLYYCVLLRQLFPTCRVQTKVLIGPLDLEGSTREQMQMTDRFKLFVLDYVVEMGLKCITL